jgi:hypothetical protein
MAQVHSMVKGLLRRAGYALVRLEDHDPEATILTVEATRQDREIVERVREFTMTSRERLWALLQAVRYVVANDIAGDLVECGVWRGGSAMTMALQLRALGVEDRQLWLYDTFDGMTAPTAVDVDTHSGRSADQVLSTTTKVAGYNAWCIASLDDVRANMVSTGYPIQNVHFKAGDVAVTLRDDPPHQVSLLRLDTDWYESTKVELEVLFPALVPGGVCIIDDYGDWEGARGAVDGYFAEHGLSPLMNRIDYTGRLFVKYG